MSATLHRLLDVTLSMVIISAILTASTAAAHSAFEDGAVAKDEPKAHVHGKAEMQLNIQRNKVVIDMKIPVMDVLGFEHEPETATEKQLVEDAITYLKEANQWMEFPATAGCAVESSHTRSPYESAHAHEQEHHHSHDDFSVNATWNCTEPAALNSIQVNLFARMPGVQVINVSWIANEIAGVATLTPTAKRISPVAER